MAETVENDEENHALLIKNLPKKFDDIMEVLQAIEPHAKAIKSFGKRRALLSYANHNEAQSALVELEKLEFAGRLLNVMFFNKEKPVDYVKKPPRKIDRTTQTKVEKKVNTMDFSEINKQLGLIDTIYVDGAQPAESNNSSKTSSKSKKTHISMQAYNYVIAVDFEATCWEKQAPPRWRESEIIEFPAVLVNLKTGKIEAEFHKYIMPIESPKLSNFCTELTGITQKMVDNGIPLQTALMMFQEWVRKELKARNLILPKMSKDNRIGNCAFITWTDWDFGICLNKECNRKRLKKQPYFNQWIDIRAIYREWYKYRPVNFLDALTHVGLNFEGREHSGIDDAKNLAALAFKMVRDGAILAVTKDLTPFTLNLNCVL